MLIKQKYGRKTNYYKKLVNLSKTVNVDISLILSSKLKIKTIFSYNKYHF